MTHASSREAVEIMVGARARIESSHRAAVGTLPDPVRRVAGYHIGWWDADGRAAGGGGKAVRPALVLACARAVGGENASRRREVVDAAVAVELVHDFSLLHDDIMDGDLMRRHRGTAWSVFGTARAILTGDMLLLLVFDLLKDALLKDVMTETALELCAGQSADLSFESRARVGLAECLRMAEAKTGALLGCACQLGALAGGADPDRAGRFREIGRSIGLAFQLVDDLLGIWGDPAETGKPVHSDLMSRKKSLPVVAALTSGTHEGERLAALYERADPFTEAELPRVAELVEAAGAREWARAEASAYAGAAMNDLDQAAVSADGAADLRTLATMITRRAH